MGVGDTAGLTDNESSLICVLKVRAILYINYVSIKLISKRKMYLQTYVNFLKSYLLEDIHLTVP